MCYRLSLNYSMIIPVLSLKQMLFVWISIKKGEMKLKKSRMQIFTNDIARSSTFCVTLGCEVFNVLLCVFYFWLACGICPLVRPSYKKIKKEKRNKDSLITPCKWFFNSCVHHAWKFAVFPCKTESRWLTEFLFPFSKKF